MDYIAYVTLFLTIIVTITTIREFFLSRERFKLELFEKRYAVYAATRKFLSSISRDGHLSDEAMWEFRRDTNDAVFLFKQDIVDYLRALSVKAEEMRTADSISKSLSFRPEEQKAVAHEKGSRLFMELAEELRGIEKLFAPYLKFDVWRKWWQP